MSLDRVVFICADTVGDLMAGPAIRSVELASVLASAGHRVVLAAPPGSRLELPGVDLVVWEDVEGLGPVVAGAGAIVVFAPVLADNLWLATLG
ncbi:MAG: hypothetical protein EBX39_10775, partial [Actinobacteria bacterium]|nr:hypothetical protein [Actinomycetota bacterium]